MNVAPTEPSNIKILDTDAGIGNLKLDSEELHTVSIQFTPYNKETKGNAVFFLDLTQYASGATEGEHITGNPIIGGQRFVIKTKADLEHRKWKEEKLVFDGARWVRKRTKTVARRSLRRGSGLRERRKKPQTTRTRRRA